jgi:hypothetical protein
MGTSDVLPMIYCLAVFNFGVASFASANLDAL